MYKGVKMMMSFQEKSTWVSLGITLLIFGAYFTFAFGVFSDAETPAGVLIPVFIATVVATTIIQAFLHTILGIAFNKEAEKGADERDHLIELRATRISYFILVFGVFATGVSMLLTASPIMMANIILFFFILAEVVGFSIQLFYYRRGI